MNEKKHNEIQTHTRTYEKEVYPSYVMVTRTNIVLCPYNNE